jgi:hypothetical protein
LPAPTIGRRPAELDGASRDLSAHRQARIKIFQTSADKTYGELVSIRKWWIAAQVKAAAMPQPQA